MRFNSQDEAVMVHERYHNFSEGRDKQFTPGNEFFDLHKSRINWIAEQIPLKSRVLDIGCSGGEFLRYLQYAKHITAVGVDVNKSCIEKARERCIDAHFARAEALPFEKEFDVCLLSEVLEHLYEPADCLRECNRVLLQNGIIVGSVPHCDSPIIESKPAHVYMFHSRDYDSYALRELLERFFSKVVIKTVSINDKPMWFVFRGEV